MSVELREAKSIHWKASFSFYSGFVKLIDTCLLRSGKADAQESTLFSHKRRRVTLPACFRWALSAMDGTFNLEELSFTKGLFTKL